MPLPLSSILINTIASLHFKLTCIKPTIVIRLFLSHFLLLLFPHLVPHHTSLSSSPIIHLPSVARGQSLFGDPTAEIQDLTQVIKQDLAKLNSDIAELQQQVRSHSGRESRHMKSHSNTVVVSLQVSRSLN